MCIFVAINYNLLSSHHEDGGLFRSQYRKKIEELRV